MFFILLKFFKLIKLNSKVENSKIKKLLFFSILKNSVFTAVFTGI